MGATPPPEAETIYYGCSRCASPGSGRWRIYCFLFLHSVILISWGLALFEYVFQVPANRMGFEENGGPFNLFQLKVIQEVVSLTVFTLCAVFVFKTDKLAWNHVVGFVLLVAAVYVIFKKW
ncbi:DMT family protein [Hymenobacter taeanensis]|uniref:DMT family protein n=1 Tax=Hymenobacter taeanensis TaxID=2735321 RepID=A0A6M6BQD0_9BACT|nr:DMT family protein [Hymenobacter taeanensis]